eukprot:gene53392-72959_t
MTAMRIAVAIPCYKVTQHVLGVINAIGPEVEAIYAMDDACPDGSGRFIAEHNTDPRVRVLYNPQNLGVGGSGGIGADRGEVFDGEEGQHRLGGFPACGLCPHSPARLDLFSNVLRITRD